MPQPYPVKVPVVQTQVVEKHVDRPIFVEKHIPVATAAPAVIHSSLFAQHVAAPAAYSAGAYAPYSYGPTHIPHVEHYHH